MKEAFIYPNGITGRMLGIMMTHLYNIPIHYIDDSAPETSLQAHAKTLRERQITVLVPRSPYNEQTADVLCAKLRAEGIAYNDNALEELALQSIAAIDALLRKRQKPTIAIEMIGMADDKHIGLIDSELLSRNADVQILYLCGLPEPFAKVRAQIEGSGGGGRNCLVRALPCFYFHQLSSVQALIKTSMYFSNKNSHVPTFYLGHALVDWTNYQQNQLHLLQQESYDYACVAGEDFLPRSREDCYLHSGYLGFDRIAPDISGETFAPRNIVLFAPYNMDEMWKMFGLVKAALSEQGGIYDVRLRVRYRNVGEPSSHWDSEGMAQILAQLSCYSNFSIDENEHIVPQSYNETFCCVCGATTMCYTYPLLALRPSIVLADGARVLPSALGIVLETSAETQFMGILNRIYAEQETWHSTLLQYREQKIYHFGRASAWLADFVLKKLGL